MKAAGRVAVACILGSLASPAAAEPAGLWGVLDRLDPRTRVTTAPGWRVEGEARTWSAVRDALEWSASARFESRLGWGAAGRRRAVAMDGKPSFTETRFSASWRRDRYRIAAGIERAEWAGESARSWSGEFHALPSGNLLLGGWIQWPLADAGADPRAALQLAASAAPWGALLTLGPIPGAWALAGEVRVRPGIRVRAAYGGGAPELGASWLWGPLELRGASARHRHWGRVDRIVLLWRAAS